MRIIVPALPLFASFALSAVLLCACTDAGKCTRGEIGCACTLDNGCDSGARCSNGMCVEGSTSGSGGKGAGSGGTGGDIECSDASFADACEGFCQALCANQEAMCLNSECAANDCGQAACKEACDADTDCMVRACEAQLEMTCETFGAKDNGTGVFKSFCFENDPTCVVSPDLGCSDTCGKLSSHTGGDLADNGICEDGGSGSSSMACTRGTDCSDCKPRMCAGTLESCARNGDCCGFTAGDSFCVKTGETSRVCLAACSNTKPCEGSALCTPLSAGSDQVCVP